MSFSHFIKRKRAGFKNQDFGHVGKIVYAKLKLTQLIGESTEIFFSRLQAVEGVSADCVQTIKWVWGIFNFPVRVPAHSLTAGLEWAQPNFSLYGCSGMIQHKFSAPLILSFSFLHIWLQITELETWKLLAFGHWKLNGFPVFQLMAWKHWRKMSEIKYLWEIVCVKKVGKRSRGERRGETPFLCQCKRRQVRNMTPKDIGASWKTARFREGLLQARVTHHNLFSYSFNTRHSVHY